MYEAKFRQQYRRGIQGLGVVSDSGATTLRYASTIADNMQDTYLG